MPFPGSLLSEGAEFLQKTQSSKQDITFFLRAFEEKKLKKTHVFFLGQLVLLKLSPTNTLKLTIYFSLGESLFSPESNIRALNFTCLIQRTSQQ